MPDFNLIARADPLVEVVLRQLTEAIVNGSLLPGDKLVETRLSESLGVSRGPLREALRRLEQMGLVQKVPYRGTFVATLTPSDVQELHTVRASLEGLAARLIAERGDVQAVQRLDALLEEMRQAALEGDHARMKILDADFHDALIRESGHKLLQEIWSVVSIRLRRFILLKRQRLYRELDQAASLHAPIVRAIAQGDADRAEDEVCWHISQAAQNLEFEELTETNTEHAAALP